MASKKSKMFSIDDAFEEEQTDAIRVYGATTTTERSPLNTFSRNGYISQPNNPMSDDVSIQIHDPNNPQSIKPVIRGIAKIKMEHDNISKDSDSLIVDSPDEEEKDFDPALMPWWKHPKVKENKKMVAAALALFIIGLGLSIAGIVIMSLPINGLQGAVFFITGVICFIPGSYHVFYIYLAVKGHRGYDFNFLPLFN